MYQVFVRYYGDFRYAGRNKLWEPLKERARKDGKLEETVMKRQRLGDSDKRAIRS